MKTKKIATILFVSCIVMGTLNGCGKTTKPTNEVKSYNDMVEDNLNSETDDYISGTNSNGEFSSGQSIGEMSGEIDYDNYSMEEIKDYVEESSGVTIELSEGASQLEKSKTYSDIKSSDLRLGVSNLMMNVICDYYSPNEDITNEDLNKILGLTNEDYSEMYAQKNETLTTYFFAIETSDKTKVLNALKNFVSKNSENSNISNAIICSSSRTNSDLVFFIAIDFTNKESSEIKVPAGWTLIEQNEDGTYKLEGFNDAGDTVIYTGQVGNTNEDIRATMVECISNIGYTIE